MYYDKAKELASELMVPYTKEEHRMYVKEMSDTESPNIMGKCFKVKIAPRTNPSLGLQIVLPDGQSLGRVATCSRKPVGSIKWDNTGASLKLIVEEPRMWRTPAPT